MTDPWLAAAVRDNAEWCDAMCRAHGMPGAFRENFWSNPRRTPVLYPDAVTLTSAASEDEVLAVIDRASPEATIKDSFARLDLKPAGFRVLFDAQWIMRPPGPGTPSDDLRAATGDPITWGTITTAAELRDWDTEHHGGWDGTLFPTALLSEPCVTILAGRIEDDIVCGSVLTTCAPTAGPRAEEVVGLSNIFASGCDIDAAWEGAVIMAASVFPGRALVGYERPDDLEAPLRQRFTPIGPLRVWTS